MNSLERFYATVERKPVDRPAAWLGSPEEDAIPGLLEYYQVDSLHELKLAVGDDFYAVEIPYHSECADVISNAFNWHGHGKISSSERTLTSSGIFAEAEDSEDIAFYEWPDPSNFIDPKECLERVSQAPEGKVCLGILWSAHFQNVCAAFGMENAMMNMVANEELYQEVDRKILDFFLKANEIFYEATKGKLHAILIGNDLGSQRGLMISPEMVRKFVIPGAKELIDQAHSYGLKVIYHSCGAISDIIPDLIEAGADIIHPIQALATGMEPRGLKEKFGDRVTFAGGVDTQDLLVNGSVEDVYAKVRELREIFPTGLIVSPSHEAIMADVPPRNMEALFKEATKME